MFVFGVGLGLIQQVLVVAVQNAVSYEELGVATSGATFFRMIGGSFGTAVFGAIYANVLTHKLARVVATLPKGAKINLETLDPGVLHELARLYPEAHEKILSGITSTLQTVFLVAVPIAALAFLLSWLLPELPLRKSIATVDVSEGFGLPDSRSSLQEIQLSLERIASRENRVELYQTMAHRAGIDLPPQSVWLLYRLADRPAATVREVADRLKVKSDILQHALQGLIRAGMVAEVQRGPEHDLALTPSGGAAMDRLTEARRTGLTDLLEGWNPREHPEIIAMVKDLASSLLADDEKMVEDALPPHAETAAAAATAAGGEG
jgi:DNA-binding MarR family transcriptional regulator